MPNINISVRNKIATQTDKTEYICGNSDFVIKFDFDSEWDAFEAKTARFKYNGAYKDVVFMGDQCEVPIISNTNNISIGVYAGNLHTTTAALILCEKSILCGDEIEAKDSLLGSNEIIEAIVEANEKQVQTVTQIVDGGYDKVLAAIGNMFGKTETVLCTVTAADFDENHLCLIPSDYTKEFGTDTNVIMRFRNKAASIEQICRPIIVPGNGALLFDGFLEGSGIEIALYIGFNPSTNESYPGFCASYFAGGDAGTLPEEARVQFVRVDYKKIPIEYIDTTDIENAVNSIAKEARQI